MKVLCVTAVLAAVGGCTRPNPGVCCTSEEDCAALGVSELRPCSSGLACIDNRCEVPPLPECATGGCGPDAPVCVVETGTCGACEDETSCERFVEAPHCDLVSGACVECRDAGDCDPATPICSSGTCRTCEVDAECSSGACGLDGACVPGDRVVYVASDGSDAGDCTFIQPCRTLGDGALPRTSPTRNHIVMAPGEYGSEQVIRIDATRTTASELVIHGGGAHVTATNAEVLFEIALPITIRELSITYPGKALQLTRPATLERLSIRAGTGASTNSQLTARDVDVASTGPGGIALILHSGGSLRLERGILHGGRSAIQGSTGAVVEISNLVAYGTSNVALDLPSVNGSIEFSTIGDSGTGITTGARGLTCWFGLTVRSSIIWTPAGNPIVGDCTLVDVIAGPAAVTGASNTNPLFVNGYHLSPNSPAKDAVDVGPALDYEGEPRPLGARFDIGADETD